MYHEAEFVMLMLLFCHHWQVAEQIGKVEGVKKVLLAENDVFKGLLPGQFWLCLDF